MSAHQIASWLKSKPPRIWRLSGKSTLQGDWLLLAGSARLLCVRLDPDISEVGFATNNLLEHGGETVRHR